MRNQRLYFCTKCGFDGREYKYQDNKCPRCKSTNIELVPDKYIDFTVETVPLLETELEDEFIEEVVKKSPNFSQEAFDRRQNWIKRGTELYNASQQSKTTSNSNVPKCPTCGSTNLSKISTAKKVGKIALFGIFGMGDNGKTWKCNSCGSRF